MPGPSPLEFSMNETATEAGRTVSLSGDLDVNAAKEVAAALTGNLASGQPVIIDLTEVVFIDSSGLGAIVMTVKTEEQRARITLVPSRHPQAQQVLRITGTVDYFGSATETNPK
jgi:anti-sigma B factor antagonist